MGPRIVAISYKKPLGLESVQSGLAIVLKDGVTLEEATALAQQASGKARRKEGSTPESVLNAVVEELGAMGDIVHCDAITVETEPTETA